MQPYFFSRRALAFFAGLAILLAAFTVFEAQRQHRTPAQQSAEAQPPAAPLGQEAEAAFQPQEGGPLDDTQRRHLALWGERLCVFAGPLGGNGALLQQLDIPLKSIPPRWLAQLTNGGIEFPDEETLFMALDNIDELIEENSEVLALPQL